MTIRLLGVNHRTAMVGVRERLAYSDDEIVGALTRLKQRSAAIREICSTSFFK